MEQMSFVVNNLAAGLSRKKKKDTRILISKWILCKPWLAAQARERCVIFGLAFVLQCANYFSVFVTALVSFIFFFTFWIDFIEGSYRLIYVVKIYGTCNNSIISVNWTGAPSLPILWVYLQPCLAINVCRTKPICNQVVFREIYTGLARLLKTVRNVKWAFDGSLSKVLFSILSLLSSRRYHHKATAFQSLGGNGVYPCSFKNTVQWLSVIDHSPKRLSLSALVAMM